MFIQLVQANSPAALAGLRFGDQVLQINGQNCAGWSTDKAHKALKAAAEQRIELVVRDRSVQSLNLTFCILSVREPVLIFNNKT